VLRPAFRRLSSTRSLFSSLDGNVDIEEPFALSFEGGLDGPEPFTDPDSETISDSLNHDHVSWVPPRPLSSGSASLVVNVFEEERMGVEVDCVTDAEEGGWDSDFGTDVDTAGEEALSPDDLRIPRRPGRDVADDEAGFLGVKGTEAGSGSS